MAVTRDYQAVGYKLLNSTGVTAFVSNRIFHGDIPEGSTTLPAINYFFISRPNILYGHGERVRYQISCRSTDPGECMNLAHEVHSALNNVQESVNGFDIQDIRYDGSNFVIEPNGIYHIPVDVFVTYINQST